MPSYLPYVGTGANNQVSLGHFATAQFSGNIAATPTALDVHGRIRWAPSLTTASLVLVRSKIAWACLTAITAAVRNAYQLSIARGFTVDFTTAITNCDLAAKPGNNCMRAALMSNSQMGTAGPGICTTAPCTGMTYTLDSNPIAIQFLPQIVGTNATGTVVTLSLGMGTTMQTLYEWTGVGQHPVTLRASPAEGIALQLTHTGHATGTTTIYWQNEWAEVLAL